jgi:sulfotransferase
VAWVMDSIERLYRNNPFEQTKLFSDESERNSVYSRVETLAQRNRLVGFAWSALKEAYYGDQAQSMLVLDYMLLAQSPERVLRLVYEFLGQSWYEGHDFDRVEYDAPAFDAALGVSGLHRVRSQVEVQSRRTLLPPDLFEQYSKLSFWENGASSAAHVIRPKPEKSNT